MARKIVAVSLGLAMLATFFAYQGAAQSSGCMTEIVSLSPCLGYMSGNASAPSSSCCSALSSVVKSNPRCLCMVLGGAASSLGITINNTRALELPGACKVQTPPVSQCSSVGVPVAPPTASPTPATPTTPATPATPATHAPQTPSTTPATPATPSVPSVTPAGSGSKATPSTTDQSSNGSINKSGMMFILFLTAFASLHVF